MERFDRDDLPLIYRLASDQAKRYKNRYQYLVRWQILITFVSVAFGIGGAWLPWSARTGALLAAVAVIIALLLWFGKPDRTWYRSRAVAEFIKSQAWRFMTGADPYPIDLPAGEAEAKLEAVLRERATASAETKELTRAPGNPHAVTPAMQTARTETWAERKESYLTLRANDQLRFYGESATKSLTIRDLLYGLLLTGQFFSIIFAFINAIDALPINLLGIMTWIATAATTWLRSSRHEDLAPSYQVTGRRLRSLIKEADTVLTEKELGVYLCRVEDLLTREHEEWLIRRS